MEAHVPAADLAPALDENDAELAVAFEHVAHHQPIARLEHVERQVGVREENRAERKHGQDAVDHGPHRPRLD